MRISLLLVLFALSGPAEAFTAKDITPEVFALGEAVAARSRVLYDANKSDGHGVGFSYSCMYWDALCMEASPRGDDYDMRITVNSSFSSPSYIRILCVLSGAMNILACRSQTPAVRMSFQKIGGVWMTAPTLKARTYGKTFAYDKRQSCNALGCEELK